MEYQKYQKYKQRYLTAKQQHYQSVASGGATHHDYDEAQELDVIINVATPEGNTIKVSTPSSSTIAELKRDITRQTDHNLSYSGLIELYLGGQEDALANDRTLTSLAITDDSTVFMLVKADAWFWKQRSPYISLSGSSTNSFYGQTARVVDSRKYRWGQRQLVTGGNIMESGEHYWEIKIISGGRDHANLFIGACTPIPPINDNRQIRADYANIDLSWEYPGYFISSSGLYGNGASFINDHRGCEFREGNTIGILLNLDTGTIKFYRDGKRFGPDWPGLVKGPLLRAAVITVENTEIEIVSNPQRPEN